MVAPDHIAVQRAVYQALSGRLELLSLLPNGTRGVGVFVHPDNTMPYVVIEGISSRPLRTQVDTLDDYEIVCAVYSDQPANTQVRAILREVGAALAQPLDIDGYRVVIQQSGAVQAQPIGDGKIYRGACALRLVVEKVET